MNKITLLFPFFLSFFLSFGQDIDSVFIRKQPIDFQGKFFLKYNHFIGTNVPSYELNTFQVYRAYLTVNARLTKSWKMRFTADVMPNTDNNVKPYIMYAKYAYAQYDLSKIFFLKNSYLQFGIIPRPWIEYEESMNAYRVLSVMFVESYDIVNSADVGLAMKGNLGEKIGDTKWNGRWGSYAIGIYNGGGYKAAEKNNNKTLEWRISFRPFKKIDFKTSYSGIYGKTNLNLPENYGLFTANIFSSSFNNKFFTVILQYYRGKGNYDGSAYNLGLPDSNRGFSFFSEIRFKKIAFFGRYDNFSNYTIYSQRFQTGVSFRFYKQSKFVLALNNVQNISNPYYRIQFALDIRFNTKK